MSLYTLYTLWISGPKPYIIRARRCFVYVVYFFFKSFIELHFTKTKVKLSYDSVDAKNKYIYKDSKISYTSYTPPYKNVILCKIVCSIMYVFILCRP